MPPTPKGNGKRKKEKGRYLKMCVICVSANGVRQPSEEMIKMMWYANPHGAGYMVARNNRVEIHKGFMDLKDYIEAIRHENFGVNDSVVYHFRISTQAGVTPTMTHPFPLTKQLKYTEALDVTCNIGVAHNGIIQLTTDHSQKRYSDTALFITDYLKDIIRQPSDLTNKAKLDEIYDLAQSKFAIMERGGYIATVGEFVDINGLKFSNDRFFWKGWGYSTPKSCKSYRA